MNNIRFATAIHILSILSNYPEDWISSDFLAGSININAVLVRKELIVLRNAGLIKSKKGKEGGVKLEKDAWLISVADIYNAVKNSEVLGKKNPNPNPKCKVGKDINAQLDVLFTETDEVVVNFLSDKRLSDFAKQFK